MCDGIVLYTDGSFRHNKAGWGVHGYTYTNVALSAKTPAKQQPTPNGYLDVKAEDTCTPVDYIDAFGRVDVNPTNNTAELSAVLNGFKIALETPAKRMLMLMDSEYVLKGLDVWSPKWIKNNWLKADGTEVANRVLWEPLLELRQQWLKDSRKLELRWVKGHSNDLGNDKADQNALLGGGAVSNKVVQVDVKGETINKLKKVQMNPLILESRMVFGINSGKPADGYYYLYSLGTMHNAGHKPRDTPKDKLAKSDLLFGRPISEATFGVFKANGLDDYLQQLIGLHTAAYGTENPELGILNLANCCNAKVRQRIESMGVDGLMRHDDIYTLSTPEMALVSRTLNPPRRANDAVAMFSILRRRLDEYLEGKLGESVEAIDITDKFYGIVEQGKKKVLQLHKTITQNTSHVEIPVTHKDRSVKVRLVLALDIPSRNQLARIATGEIKVELLIVAVGPKAYSYSTVFVTNDGAAIYQSPYTQFILPK